MSVWETFLIPNNTVSFKEQAMRAFKDIRKPILVTQLRIIRYAPGHVIMALATETARIVWLYELVALGFSPLLVFHLFVVVD